MVSLGIRAALYLSRKLIGLPVHDEAEVLQTLSSLKLPLQLPRKVDPGTVLAHAMTDKKFRGGKIRFVLLKRLGEPVLSDAVTIDDLKEALSVLGTAPRIRKLH